MSVIKENENRIVKQSQSCTCRTMMQTQYSETYDTSELPYVLISFVLLDLYFISFCMRKDVFSVQSVIFL